MSAPGDEPPPLEEMFEVDSGTDSEDSAGVPDLDDVPAAREAVEAAAGDQKGAEEEDDAPVIMAPPANAPSGDEPTLMDEILAASLAANKAKAQKQAAQRKKDSQTFGSGLSAKAMFSAPVVVDDGSDDDEAVGAGSGVGAGAANGAGGGSGAGAAARSGAAGASERRARHKRRAKVHKRPANAKQEARLLAAAAKGNEAGVRAAVALKLNLNCQAGNKGGQTALALAAHGGFADVVNELLAHDADPNAVTKTGKTPLMVAARAGKEAIVAALLDAGAKTGMKDASGKTALDYARQKKRNYIVEVLQKHAAEHADEDSDVEEEVFLTKSGAPEKDNLLLPEVQAAMRNGGAQMAEETIKRGEWVTPEFLKKLAAHPMLAEGLTNPRFMAAIQEFQTAPAKAKKKFENDPAVNAFMAAFYKLLSEHFTELGEKQEKEEKQKAQKAAEERARQVEEALDHAAATADDPAVRQALQNKRLRDMLMDPELKAALDDASRNDGRLQHYLRDPVMGPKLRELERGGFVKFA